MRSDRRWDQYYLREGIAASTNPEEHRELNQSHLTDAEVLAELGGERIGWCARHHAQLASVIESRCEVAWWIDENDSNDPEADTCEFGWRWLVEEVG